LHVQLKPRWDERQPTKNVFTLLISPSRGGSYEEWTRITTVFEKPAIQWLADLCRKCAFHVKIEFNITKKSALFFPTNNTTRYQLVSFDDDQKYFGKNDNWKIAFALYGGFPEHLSLNFFVPTPEKQVQISRDFATQIEKFRAEGY
jgi:hypothetical protein